MIFFPVYALIGGWDDESIRIVKRSAKMSGPSKMLVNIIAKISIKMAKISPLHGKFPIKYDGVYEEIEELTKTRNEKIKEKRE